MLFLHPILLLGLVAVLIPPLVSYVARQRYQEVDWGAMQFLRLSPKARRTLFAERWLLLGARMATLALLVIALAGPVVRSSRWLSAEGERPRSTVLLVDCSASMGHRREGESPRDAVTQWVAGFLARSRPGDRFAVLAVSGEVAPIIGTLGTDPEAVRGALEVLPSPRGTADWPAAVEAAAGLLSAATGQPEILALTNGQKFGWADEATLARWELLAAKRTAAGPPLPRLWVANVLADHPLSDPGASLLPITATRPVATPAEAVTLETGVRWNGPAEHPPRIRLEIDGRAAGELPFPSITQPGPDVPIHFSRRFAPGSHLVTLRLDSNPPMIVGRQDFALDVVPEVPVLIVDGEMRPDARTFGSNCLRAALAPTSDPSGAFAVRSVGIADFSPATISQDVRGPGTRPWVVILSNVRTLTPEQTDAIERFLASGGGVLVAPGDRVDPVAWERSAFRNGRGWLPTRLERIVATDSTTTTPTPQIASFVDPPVRVFREERAGGLHTATFPHYWKLDPSAALPRSHILGVLSNADPFLVEKATGRGRVMICAVPLKDGWRTNLTTLPDYIRLIHELTFHLAGSRLSSTEWLTGGRLAYRPLDEPPGPVTVFRPDGSARVVPVGSWPVVIEGFRDPGGYKLTTGTGRVQYVAMPAEPREADLTPIDDSDIAALHQIIGQVAIVTSPEHLQSRQDRGPQTREVRWLFLVAVLALLGVELWYTRRLLCRGG